MTTSKAFRSAALLLMLAVFAAVGRAQFSSSLQGSVLDTAETRTQMTINTDALDSLPLPGRDLLALTTIAPGVTGLGVAGSGGNGQLNDNYAAETQVSASANGRSSVGNVFVLDGLDI